MIVIKGEQQLLDKLRKADIGARQWHKKPLEIGYSAPHAIHVHEDMEMRHPNGGKAKFLTDPFYRLMPVLRIEIRKLIRNGKTPTEAFMIVSKIIMDASLAECPVDTGELSKSIFVKQGKG